MVVKSVGLVILTHIPAVGYVAILRERGNYNFEKKRPEDWPGGCQITICKEIEDKEDFLWTLKKEISKELGRDFFVHFSSQYLSKIVAIQRVVRPERESITYSVFVDFDLLAKIRFQPGSGGVKFLRPIDFWGVVDLENYPKKFGVLDRRTIALPKEEREAVFQAFKHFNSFQTPKA